MAAALTQRAPLLAQAGLVVDGAERLAAVPLLLEGHAPDPVQLPALVVALVRDVDWEGGDEQCQVAGVAAAVAAAYALAPLEAGGGDNHRRGAGGSGGVGGSGGAEDMEVDAAGCGQQAGSESGGGGIGGGGGQGAACGSTGEGSDPGAQLAAREWLCRHLLFPAAKALLKPPAARARDGSVLLLTSMERLYRVFERCG